MNPNPELTTKEQKPIKKKVGFALYPENRYDPAKHGERLPRHSISACYKKLLGFTVQEFKEWEKNYPATQRTMAEEIAYKRVYDARNHKTQQLANTVEITDRTEGKAKQYVEQEIKTNALAE